jgi:hypothetical protein
LAYQINDFLQMDLDPVFLGQVEDLDQGDRGNEKTVFTGIDALQNLPGRFSHPPGPGKMSDDGYRVSQEIHVIPVALK